MYAVEGDLFAMEAICAVKDAFVPKETLCSIRQSFPVRGEIWFYLRRVCAIGCRYV